MNSDLTCLRDPLDGSTLTRDDNSVRSKSGSIYPIIGGIPRFVDSENYCDDFGTQWNMFPKTQLDSYTGFDISESRLARCLRGNLGELKDKIVLEAGSGAGRFTEILLKHGATVHSFDFSSAVNANADNNGATEKLVLVQADIRKIPFAKASYDYVICLGVLQHTPDTEESIQSLWKMVRKGGALVIDHYPAQWRRFLPPPIGGARYLYRMLILKLSKRNRFKTVKFLTDFWFPWHWKFKDSLFLQRVLVRLSPVVFYYPAIKLRDRQMHYEWSLLDTHDATTDAYQHVRTRDQIRSQLEVIGAVDIVVEHGGNGIEAFCRK